MAQVYSKTFRLNLVLETVKSLGKALPADVCVRVAMRLAVDGRDPAFLRSIYRDLKQLADEGQLKADVLSADGSPLDPNDSDTAKNIRVEYSMPESEGAQIPGWKMLHDFGGRLILSERNMGWKIAHSLHSKPDDHFSLLFRVHGGRWAVLQLPQADLPAKILFCRESESDRLPSDFKKYVADVHGLRTIVFVCPDQSVSRGSTTGRMGHALLQLQNDKSMRLLDLGSKTGTFFASCNESILADAFSTKFSDSTVPISLNPFEVDAQWNGITTNPVVVPPAAMIRLGTFRAAVLIK